MHIANQASKSTASPVINFATETKTSLAALIAAFAAAEREVGEASDLDEAQPHNFELPHVRGGVSLAVQISTGGKSVEIPAKEWFYSSLDAIDRDYERHVAEATTAEQRDETDKRFAAYRAEFARQEKAIARAIPKEKRASERRLEKAHRALTAAEDKIVNYRPSNMSEAAALLEYASRGTRYCFTVDERDLHTIMRNAASAIRAAQ
ncbi:hypothetical protein [Tardiphaga sp. P5_C7]